MPPPPMVNYQTPNRRYSRGAQAFINAFGQAFLNPDGSVNHAMVEQARDVSYRIAGGVATAGTAALDALANVATYVSGKMPSLEAVTRGREYINSQFMTPALRRQYALVNPNVRRALFQSPAGYSYDRPFAGPRNANGDPVGPPVNQRYVSPPGIHSLIPPSRDYTSGLKRQGAAEFKHALVKHGFTGSEAPQDPRFVGQTKLVDTVIRSPLSDPTVFFHSESRAPIVLNIISPGVNFYQRVNDCITMTRLQGTIWCDAALAGVGPENDQWRVLVVYDLQTNGVLPSTFDIVRSYSPQESTAFTGYPYIPSFVSSYINPDAKKRFHFLYDSRREISFANGSPPNQSAFVWGVDRDTNCPIWKFDLKLNHPVLYQGCNPVSTSELTGSVGDIKAGGLYLVFFCDANIDDDCPVSLASIRLTFIDSC